MIPPELSNSVFSFLEAAGATIGLGITIFRLPRGTKATIDTPQGARIQSSGSKEYVIVPSNSTVRIRTQDREKRQHLISIQDFHQTASVSVNRGRTLRLLVNRMTRAEDHGHAGDALLISPNERTPGDPAEPFRKIESQIRKLSRKGR